MTYIHICNVFIAHVTCSDFPDADYKFPYAGSCYYYFDEGVKYSMSKSRCQTQSAHVVTFETDTEENYVANKLQCTVPFSEIITPHPPEPL